MKLRILAVSAEHNVDHAALADTMNIAEVRGGKIFPGNSAVGEVIAIGPAVKKFKVGDIVLTHCNGEPDIYGYPLRIWAYDQPDSIGWYGEEAVVGDWQVIQAPLECGLNLWEIAALPLRAPTAYHLWRRAHRHLPPEGRRASRSRALNVLGFGGGVSELFLMLAQQRGPPRDLLLGQPGAAQAPRGPRHRVDRPEAVQPLRQRRRRQGLQRARQEADGRRSARTSSATCCAGPSTRPASQALARLGVNVSAGWQLDTKCTYNSANLSVRQITLDHIHFETVDGSQRRHRAVRHACSSRPCTARSTRSRICRARCTRCTRTTQTGIPIVRVARKLPESVARLGCR